MNEDGCDGRNSGYGGGGRSWEGGDGGCMVDDGDDGTEGEPGAEVSFGAVAMEKQSLWNGFVNF